MSLNCKPGDLACVISTPETRESQAADWIIKVTELCEVANGGRVAWRYEGRLRRCPAGVFKGMRIYAFADDCLRPIRDPGDDAVDEMLTLAPPAFKVPA